MPRTQGRGRTLRQVVLCAPLRTMELLLIRKAAHLAEETALGKLVVMLNGATDSAQRIDLWEQWMEGNGGAGEPQSRGIHFPEQGSLRIRNFKLIIRDDEVSLS